MSRPSPPATQPTAGILNDAPYDEQASIGQREAAILLNASREGVPSVAIASLATAIASDGLAQVDGLLPKALCKSLLAHVNHVLTIEDERVGEQRESMLGAVLCRQKRYDLKLDLTEDLVNEAFQTVLSAVGPSIVRLLGAHADLFELGALISDDGSAQQPLHPDTPWTRSISVVTVIVALQDVDIQMGPTIYLPRTHTQRARAAMWGFDPKGDDEISEVIAESTLRIPLPKCGDGVLFDSRTMHCGGANASKRRRVLFYFSFKRRPSWARMWLAGLLNGASALSWRGGGFDQPGTLLDSLRNTRCLASDGTLRCIVPTTEEGMDSSPSAALAPWLALATRIYAIYAWLVHALMWVWPTRSSNWREWERHRGTRVLTPYDAASRLERVAIKPSLLPEGVCNKLVEYVSQPYMKSAWRLHRHDESPTTDIEVDDGSESGGVLSWFDRELDTMGVIEQVMDEIVRLYRVRRDYLLLREMFVVRYRAGGGQDERDRLAAHRDASWFSFVVALNQEGDDYDGGGTALRDHAPVVLRRGECLVFVGQQMHGAAPISRGTRICLTGFVDMRAPLAVRDSLASQMTSFDGDFVCSSCRVIERPYLRSNIRMLQRRAKGKSGKDLLHLIAARRLALPHMDMDELETACSTFLSGEMPLANMEQRVSTFISRVLAHI